MARALLVSLVVLSAGCRVGFDPLTAPDGGEAPSPRGECSPGMPCQTEAEPGSVFEISCTPGQSCAIDCSLAATCIVDCNGAARCDVLCPEHDCVVLACDAACTATCAGQPAIQLEGNAVCP